MQEIWTQIVGAWMSLTGRQRISLALSAALTVAAVGGIVWWANQPMWSVLYTGLDVKDAQGIVQELQSRGVKHRVLSGGSQIEVPIEKIDELRIDLAGKNVPGSGRFGFVDMFSQDSIGQSNSMQRIRYQKALEDELSRTIESLDEVRSARVHLVLPGERVFLDDDEMAKASVTLSLSGSRAPSSEQVQAIARIVAGAARDLTPENVSVVDTSGRVLWEGGGDPSGMAGSRQIEKQAALEHDINTKVARVLEPIVGQDGYVVRTTADLDFKKVLRREKQIDPDSGVLLSESKSKEKQTLGSSTAGGVPGTTSNLPEGEAAPSGVNEESSNSQQEAKFDYSVVEQTVEQPIGSIRRLSVAVLVDHVAAPADEGAADNAEGTAETPGTVERSDEDLAQIEELVKAAINFDAERGDRVTVEQAPFMPLPELTVTTGFDPRSILPLVKYPALVVLLLLAFLLFYRPMMKTVQQALGAGSRSARGGGALMTGTAEMEHGLQLGPPSRIESLRQRLTTLAGEQPDGLAQTLRVWLHEEREG